MPKANKHAEVKPSKFKTTLCSFYMAEKECPFGAKCAFAHGEEELLHEQDNISLLKKTGLQRLEPLFENGAAAAEDGKLKTNIISSTSDASSATSENLQPSAPLSTPVAVLPQQQQQQQVVAVASLPTSPNHHGYANTNNYLNHFQQQQPHSPNTNTNTNNNSFAFGGSRSNTSFSQAPLKRRPVMVSLPKHNTTSEQIHSPYASAYQADSHVTQFSYNNNNNNNNNQQQQQENYYPQQQQTVSTPVRRAHQPYSGHHYIQQQQQQQYIQSADNYNNNNVYNNNNNNNNHHHHHHNIAVATVAGKCQVELSSTCKREQPLVYRHNPYRFS